MESLSGLRRLLVIAAASAAAASCVTMRAGSDYYSAADFSGYRNFAWIAESPLVTPRGTSTEVSPLNVRRIREAIERELAEKGFAQVDSGEQADFVVAFTVGTRELLDVNAYPPPFRSNWGWHTPYFGPDVDIQMYTEGTLAIDIFDRASRQPVWHGWARKRITGGDIADPEPVIDRSVDAILADFPPTARR